MYICIHTYIHTSIRTHTHTHTHTHTYTHTHTHTYIIVKTIWKEDMNFHYSMCYTNTYCSGISCHESLHMYTHTHTLRTDVPAEEQKTRLPLFCFIIGRAKLRRSENDEYKLILRVSSNSPEYT
jgi:hypothetical protein